MKTKNYYALEIPASYFKSKQKTKLKRGATSVYLVLGSKTSIGKEGSDFDLNYKSLSAVHCTFWVEDGVVILKDNGGGIGLLVNNIRPIPELKIILDENDQIIIGEMEIKLVKNPPEDQLVYADNYLPIHEVKESQLPPPFVQETPPIKKKKEKTKLSIVNSKGFSANPVMRMCGMLIDVGITILIGLNLIGLKFIVNTEYLFIKLLKPTGIFHHISDKVLPFIFMGWVLFGLQRMFFSLFLGVGLGEFCVGLRGAEGIAWNRLGGPIRQFIGLFTFPFIIFDLPAIIGRRTLKEVITSTSIKWVGFNQMFVGFFIFLPAFIIINFLWPIFIPQYKSPAIFVNNRSYPKINSDIIEKTQGQLSHQFQFSYYYNANFDLLPNVEIEQKERILHYKPKMDFYLRDKTMVASLKVMETSKLNDWLDKLIDRSLLFNSFYPNLHHYIRYSIKTQKPGIVFPEVENELVKILTQTLMLEPHTVLPFMMSNGFFLPGFLKFKSRLISLLGANTDNIAGEIVELGQKKFLMLFNQRHDAFIKVGTRKYILIPLSGVNPMIYQITWEDTPSTPLANEKFLRELSQSIVWRDLSLPNIPYLPAADDLHPFSLLDGLFNKKLPSDKRAIIENGTYQYYYKLGQTFMLSEHTQTNEFKHFVMESIKKIGTAYGKFSTSYRSSLFVNKLYDMVRAYEADNADFFDDTPEE